MSITGNTKLIILVHFLTSGFIVLRCLSPGGLLFLLSRFSPFIYHAFIVAQIYFPAKKIIFNSLYVTVSHLQSMTTSTQTILNNVLELVHPLPLHIFSIFF